MQAAGSPAATEATAAAARVDAADADEAAAAHQRLRCGLLATALAGYAIDGRAAVTLPLLAVARDPRDAALLPGLVQNVQRLGQAVEANAEFLAAALGACPGLPECVDDDGTATAGGGASDSDDELAAQGTSVGDAPARKRARRQSSPLEWSAPEREQHREDVRCVLKQLAREWSADGAEERRRTHTPVLEALRTYVPPDNGSSILRSAVALPCGGYRRGSNRLSTLVAPQQRTGVDPPARAGAAEANNAVAETGADDATRPWVLVPGSGLGRLACEIAGIGAESSADSGNAADADGAGYAVEACESGAVMSAVADLMVGLSPGRKQQWRVHPFLHDAANRSVSTDQTRSLTVPDIPSYSIYTGGVSSPLAGSGGASGGGVSNSRRCPSTSCVDFVSEYQRPEHRGRWDAVVTCFFLDTAKNPLEYIRTIAHCLKPGTGVWINTGPLLWHEATGAPPYDCLQLTAQELLQATELAGFELLEEPRLLQRVPYCRDQRSMMRVEFDTVFWVHRKKAAAAAATRDS